MTTLREVAAKRKASQEKRKKQQTKQAEKMKEDFRKANKEIGIELGSLVALRQDPRDVTGARGAPAVVYDISESAQGILAVHPNGKVAKSNGDPFWIPFGQYKKLPDDVVGMGEMRRYAALIRRGTNRSSMVSPLSLLLVCTMWSLGAMKSRWQVGGEAASAREGGESAAQVGVGAPGTKGAAQVPVYAMGTATMDSIQSLKVQEEDL